MHEQKKMQAILTHSHSHSFNWLHLSSSLAVFRTFCRVKLVAYSLQIAWPCLVEYVEPLMMSIGKVDASKSGQKYDEQVHS